MLFVLQAGEHLGVTESGELGSLFEDGILCADNSGGKGWIVLEPILYGLVVPVCGPSGFSLCPAIG